VIESEGRAELKKKGGGRKNSSKEDMTKPEKGEFKSRGMAKERKQRQNQKIC